MEKMVILSLTAAISSVKSMWKASFTPKQEPQCTEMGYLGVQ